MYVNSSMAAERREESQRGFERQGAGLREEGRDESQSSTTRGRQQARLFLRPNERHEVETNERRNSKGSRFED